jgi:hypothetical protein
VKRNKAIAVAGFAAMAVIGSTQIMAVVKLLGVGAAVKQFGPQINGAINKLSNHTDTKNVVTKVVPIISGGLASRKSVGVAQVIGPKAAVDTVQAVAQIEQDVFGREIKIRAMIPISSKKIVKDIKRVEGVGVSGIVDLKL